MQIKFKDKGIIEYINLLAETSGITPKEAVHIAVLVLKRSKVTRVSKWIDENGEVAISIGGEGSEGGPFFFD